jgi:cytoskeletal protein RodZ
MASPEQKRVSPAASPEQKRVSPAASPQQKRVSPAQRPDDGLDKIPMQKLSLGWVVAGLVVVLVVGGLVMFNLGGNNKSTPVVPELSASAEAQQADGVELKAQREHQAMTQRALAALETQKKEQTAAEAASQASAAADNAAPAADAKAPKGGPRKSWGAPPPKPAPKGVDFDKIEAAATPH